MKSKLHHVQIQIPGPAEDENEPERCLNKLNLEAEELICGLELLLRAKSSKKSNADELLVLLALKLGVILIAEE